MKLHGPFFCAFAMLMDPAGAQDNTAFSWDQATIVTLDGPYEYNDGSGTLGFITDANEDAEGKVAFLTCDNVNLAVLRRDLFETQAQCDESRGGPPHNLTMIDIIKQGGGAYTLTEIKGAMGTWEMVGGSEQATAVQAAIAETYGELSVGQRVPAVAYEQMGQTFLAIIEPVEQ